MATQQPSNGVPNQGLLDRVDKKQIMEKAFALLKSQRKNTVEGLIKYFKEAKLLDDSTEKIARQALAGVANPKNINYTKFAEVCGTVAKEKGLDLEKLTQNFAASLFGGIDSAGGSSAADASTSANTTMQCHTDDYHESEENTQGEDDQADESDHHENTDEQSDNYVSVEDEISTDSNK